MHYLLHLTEHEKESFRTGNISKVSLEKKRKDYEKPVIYYFESFFRTVRWREGVIEQTSQKYNSNFVTYEMPVGIDCNSNISNTGISW